MYSFLLFHSISELMSIIISGGIFLFGWNSRKYMESSFFVVIGISFLFISILDLIHTLAYSGMQIFEGYDANLPTQLWIAARYWQASSFLAATLVINKKLNSNYLFMLSATIFIVLMFSIFQGFFPVSFVEGYGLTPFKIISEYIIDTILFISFVFLYYYRHEFDTKVFLFIVISIAATMGSELAFTFYIGVYDFSNLVGHLLKIVASFFAYKAIIETGFDNPFKLLFRKLKESEKDLIRKAEDLESSYSEFSQMFNASLPLRIIDKNSNIIRINDTYAALFHLEKDKIIGEKCHNLPIKHLCNTDGCSMKQILSGKEEYEYEMNSVLEDGTQIAAIVKSVPYRSPSGEFIGIIQNFTDISKRKKTEIALRESEEKYRKFIEDSFEGVWIIDSKAKTTFVNQSMAKMFGYSINDMMGRRLYEFMDEDGKKQADIYFERRRMGIEEEHDFEFIHKSGRKVYASLKTNPIFDNEGHFNGAIAFVTDITDRKKAQEKIEDMARFPSENPNPVLRVSRKYVLLANRNAQMLFNIGEGSKIPNLLHNNVIETFSNNKVKKIELELNSRTYSFFITPIKDAGYVNIYGLDISDRKLAEERLERFVSTVSHELRTPISVLVMSMDYLNNYRDQITPEVEKRLQDGISRNILLLNDLVEDILTLSRIDEKKVKLDWIEYNPLDIIKEILVLMEPIGNAKNIKFEVNIDKNIQLFGDIKRIDQIFRIFIDNTLKYSKENSRIEVKAINNYKGKYNPEEKEGVLFQFKDQGLGILKIEIPHLFERFFRSEQVSDIPGTGLGLAIAKELLNLHEGEVYVETEYGKGSTFSVFLPRIKTQP